MWELYLISRLGVLFFILIFAALLALVVALVSGFDIIEEGKGKLNTKCFKCSVWIVVVCTTLTIICPTKQDALLIFGLGSTIDCIQSNEKVQELPDKCVEALDAWLDSLNDKEDKK